MWILSGSARCWGVTGSLGREGRFRVLYSAPVRGGVAQLGERRVRNAKVGSSILLLSTTIPEGPPVSGPLFFQPPEVPGEWHTSPGAPQRPRGRLASFSSTQAGPPAASVLAVPHGVVSCPDMAQGLPRHGPGMPRNVPGPGCNGPHLPAPRGGLDANAPGMPRMTTRTAQGERSIRDCGYGVRWHGGRYWAASWPSRVQ
jgi:hypothetical protein